MRLAAVAGAFALFGGGAAAIAVAINDGGGGVIGDEVNLVVQKAGKGLGRVRSSPSGIDCGSSCSAPFPTGEQVHLQATPAEGSRFAGWSGGGCTGAGTCTVTMDAATFVTATFRPRSDAHTLAVSTAGEGLGTVRSSPSGIDCSSSCTAPFPAGEQVHLQATPTEGSRFAGWSGGDCSGTDGCTVTMDAATSVTATFEQRSHALTVTTAGEGLGPVTSSPSGIDCSPSCTAPFPAGEQVQLQATAADGSRFAGWSGAGCSGTDTCTVTMDAATSVTATFDLLTHTLTVFGVDAAVTSDPSGIRCPKICTHAFEGGSSVTLTATPTGFGEFFFFDWGGACVGTDDTCEVVMTDDLFVTVVVSSSN